jgi:hypothetical protein
MPARSTGTIQDTSSSGRWGRLRGPATLSLAAACLCAAVVLSVVTTR